MSIDKVEVKNSQGNLLTLTLDDISNGYIVQEIEGLGPVKANIISSKRSTMPGEQYQASSREARNVTMKLGYAPNFSINETIWALRSRLYQYFMPGDDVTLTFYSIDEFSVDIVGHVETCEPSIFTAEPQMDISIVCTEPDFIDSTLIQINELFVTSDTEPLNLNYYGSVATGLELIQFTALGNMTGFSVYHTTPDNVQHTMVISAPILTGDEIRMCTVRGHKTLTRTRAGVTTSLMWAVDPTSQWVELKPGPNKLYISADSSVPTPVWVHFYNRYGGL